MSQCVTVLLLWDKGSRVEDSGGEKEEAKLTSRSLPFFSFADTS